MRPAVATLAAILCTGAPADDSSATGVEPPTAAVVAEKPEPAAEANANKPQEVTLPPGFKKKKRGKYTLYCKTESTTGSRFTFERCLDDAQLRDYILALQENKRDIDRIRSTCSNICTCGRPDAC
jgi:hypothetical protein